MWLLAVALLADTLRVHHVTVAAAETLHVVEAGTGAAITLVPGLFGSAFGFRQLAPLLNAAGYHTIIIEPLGIGSSSRPAKADYSLDAQAARLASVLDSLGVRRSAILAHSLGGAMAFRLAYRRPDLVEEIVSLEGGPTEEAVTPEFRRAMRFAPLIRVFGGMALVRRKIRASLISSSGDTSWVTSDVVHGYTSGAARDLGATLRVFRAMGNARELEPLAPHLKDVRCHVTLVVGTAPNHDGSVSDEEVAHLRAALTAFTVDSVPGAGHFLHEEQPEVIARIVARTLLPPTPLPRTPDPDANRTRS